MRRSSCSRLKRSVVIGQGEVRLSDPPNSVRRVTTANNKQKGGWKEEEEDNSRLSLGMCRFQGRTGILSPTHGTCVLQRAADLLASAAGLDVYPFQGGGDGGAVEEREGGQSPKRSHRQRRVLARSASHLPLPLHLPPRLKALQVPRQQIEARRSFPMQQTARPKRWGGGGGAVERDTSRDEGEGVVGEGGARSNSPHPAPCRTGRRRNGPGAAAEQERRGKTHGGKDEGSERSDTCKQELSKKKRRLVNAR